MKPEDLQALNLNEEQISKVLALSGAELDKQQQTTQTLKTQKSTLKTQLWQAKCNGNWNAEYGNQSGNLLPWIPQDWTLHKPLPPLPNAGRL